MSFKQTDEKFDKRNQQPENVSDIAKPTCVAMNSSWIVAQQQRYLRLSR